MVIMEPTGPEQNANGQEAPKRDGVYVEMRAPVFSYIANKLAPVYQQELDALRQDGSFEKIKNFHDGTFGTLMGQILDTATAQEQNELPKVTLNLTDDEVRTIREKVEVPFDAAGRMTHKQIMGELTDQYRNAKFDKRVKDVTRKIKSAFKK